MVDMSDLEQVNFDPFDPNSAIPSLNSLPPAAVQAALGSSAGGLNPQSPMGMLSQGNAGGALQAAAANPQLQAGLKSAAGALGGAPGGGGGGQGGGGGGQQQMPVPNLQTNQQQIAAMAPQMMQRVIAQQQAQQQQQQTMPPGLLAMLRGRVPGLGLGGIGYG